MRLEIMCLFPLLLSASCADVGPFGSTPDRETDGGPGVLEPDADLGPPTPTSVASVSGRPTFLAINAQYLFWSVQDGRTIERIANDGSGEVSSMSAGDASIIEITAADAEVFWLSDGAGVFASSDAEFGNPGTQIAPAVEEPWDLSVGGDSVFFGNFSVGSDPALGSLQRVPRSGGAPEVVYPNQTATLSTAASETAIYWSTFQEVHRAAFDNLGSRKTVATDQGQSLFMAASGERVCWTTRGAPAAPDDIWCSLESTNQRIAEQQAGVADLKIRGDYAYWISNEASGAGRLYRHRFADSETVVLVESDDPILDIVLDSTNLYWLQVDSRESGTGSIWKMRIE